MSVALGAVMGATVNGIISLVIVAVMGLAHVGLAGGVVLGAVEGLVHQAFLLILANKRRSVATDIPTTKKQYVQQNCFLKSSRIIGTPPPMSYLMFAAASKTSWPTAS